MEIYLRSSFKSLYEEKGKIRWKEDKQNRKQNLYSLKDRITWELHILYVKYIYVCIHMILRMPQICIILNIV